MTGSEIVEKRLGLM